MRPRDPRVDPEPGDWLCAGGFEVRIDLVEGESVRVAKFRQGEEVVYSMFSMTLTAFRDECASWQAVILAMGIPGRGSIWGVP